MNLLDFTNPDIYFGNNTEIVYEFEDNNDTIVILKNKLDYYAIRVHAKRVNWSQVYSRTFYSWDCTNIYKEKLCGYHPSNEYMPPVPKQHCHNCKNLRAEWIPQIYGTK